MTPEDVENLTEEDAKEYLKGLVEALTATYGPEWRYEILGDE